MGRHPKVGGDALFGPLQGMQDAGRHGVQAVPQAGPTMRGGSRLGGVGGGGRWRCFMGHGRDVRLCSIIRKVEFNEALLQKF